MLKLVPDTLLGSAVTHDALKNTVQLAAPMHDVRLANWVMSISAPLPAELLPGITPPPVLQ